MKRDAAAVTYSQAPSGHPLSRTLEQSVLAGMRVIADVAATLTGFAAAYAIYARTTGSAAESLGLLDPAPYRWLALVFVVIEVVAFARAGLYGTRASVLNLWELRAAVKAITLSSAVLFASLFFFRLAGFSRIAVVGGIVLAAVLVVLERRLLFALVGQLQSNLLLGRRRVLICGSGEAGRLLMKKIVQAPNIGCVVVGFLDDSLPVGTQLSCRLTQTGSLVFQSSVLGRMADWRRIVGAHGVEEVLIATQLTDSEPLRELVEGAPALGLRVGVVPQLGALRADQLAVEDLSALPVLRPADATLPVYHRALKRMFDVAVSGSLLVLSVPFWAVAALLIRLDSPGPIFFVQERVGLNGRRFRVLKFRTMHTTSNPYAHSPVGDVDSRITRVGRFLRKGGFDELPQLINVLRGDMSMVGPRPEMPFIVDQYTPMQRRRLAARPGITGLWQLSPDRHAEIHENIEYDLYYILHQSVLLDALVLLETVFFTAGLSLRKRRRGGAEETPAVLGPEVFESGLEAGNHLLVAHDQRRRGSVPESWRSIVPAACSLVDRWPVRLMVAPENLPAFDALLAAAPRMPGATRHRAEYTPYGSRAALRAQCRAALLVVTDLPHVAEAAREAGVDLLTVDDDGSHWRGVRPPSAPADALTAALAAVESAGPSHAFAKKLADRPAPAPPRQKDARLHM